MSKVPETVNPPPTKRKKTTKTKTKRPKTDRSKRLLDLVMLLLRARAPVTFREIRSQFSSYQTTNKEAGLRAFERDKANLLELGVPIRYITPEENTSLEEGGYVVELKKYRLPEVHLTNDEISALVLATSLARAVPSVGYARICDLALRKLAFDYPDPDTPLAWPPQSELDENQTVNKQHEPVLVHFPEEQTAHRKALGERFSQLETATRNRKQIQLEYQSASKGEIVSRKIDPYGLFYREQSWLLVGFCHLRNDVRSFRLDRMSNIQVSPRPRSPDFERPDVFDIRAYASRSPWSFASKNSEQVVLLLEQEALSTANEDFGISVTQRTLENGNIQIKFETGNSDYVVSRILSSKGAIQIMEGTMCKQKLDAELLAIEELYV